MQEKLSYSVWLYWQIYEALGDKAVRFAKSLTFIPLILLTAHRARKVT